MERSKRTDAIIAYFIDFFFDAPPLGEPASMKKVKKLPKGRMVDIKNCPSGVPEGKPSRAHNRDVQCRWESQVPDFLISGKTLGR